MIWREVLTGVGAALSTIILFYYLYATIKKMILPHAFSWLIWGITIMISYLAQLTENTGIGSLITLFASIQAFLIGAFSYIHSSKNTFSRGDWITLLASFVAVIFWIFTSNPFYSVIIITVVDTIAYYPTLRKGYLHPKEDMALIFLLGAIKFSISLLTFHEYTLVNTLFPAMTIISEASVFCVLVLRRYHFKTKKESPN